MTLEWEIKRTWLPIPMFELRALIRTLTCGELASASWRTSAAVAEEAGCRRRRCPSQWWRRQRRVSVQEPRPKCPLQRVPGPRSTRWGRPPRACVPPSAAAGQSSAGRSCCSRSRSVSCGRTRRPWAPTETQTQTCRAQSLPGSGSATARPASRWTPRHSTATWSQEHTWFWSTNTARRH